MGFKLQQYSHEVILSSAVSSICSKHSKLILGEKIKLKEKLWEKFNMMFKSGVY